MGFNGLKSLCFRDCGAGQSAILLSTPVFYPTCYTHISFNLARYWICNDSLESPFNVECAHGLR